VMGLGALSPAHCRLHVESVAHDSEQEPVQWTVHVEPDAHDMLPLAPSVTSQSDIPEQLMLHELPHVPVQVLPIEHASVQLSPLHPELPMSHDEFAGHAHDVPVHCGGGGVSLPPHATANRITRLESKILIALSISRLEAQNVVPRAQNPWNEVGMKRRFLPSTPLYQTSSTTTAISYSVL